MPRTVPRRRRPANQVSERPRRALPRSSRALPTRRVRSRAGGAPTAPAAPAREVQGELGPAPLAGPRASRSRRTPGLTSGGRPVASLSCPSRGRRGEEVDKQLVDAFSLVVMHPMRRVGQALHAVEVGHVVAVGLGEFGAEVGIALPPDDQCRRRDRAKLCCGILLGLSYRGAVVVDHPGCRPGLRPRLDVAFEFLRRVRRVRVIQEVSEEMPVSGAHDVLGQPGIAKKKKYQDFRS